MAELVRCEPPSDARRGVTPEVRRGRRFRPPSARWTVEDAQEGPDRQFVRFSRHGSTCSHAQSSIPTSRRLPPFPNARSIGAPAASQVRSGCCDGPQLLELHLRVSEVVEEASTVTEHHRNDVERKFVQQSRCQVLLPDLSISHDIPVPAAKQNSAARPGSVLKFARSATMQLGRATEPATALLAAHCNADACEINRLHMQSWS